MTSYVCHARVSRITKTVTIIFQQLFNLKKISILQFYSEVGFVRDLFAHEFDVHVVLLVPGHI